MVKDVLLAFALAFVPALLLFHARELEGSGGLLAVWATFTAVLTIPFMDCRWASFIRIDTRGISHFRQSGRSLCRLEWSEIEEFTPLSPSCVLIRGEGRSIWISSDFAGWGEAVDEIESRVSPVIQLRLGTRLREGETLRFGTRTPKAVAHGVYLAVVLLLSALTVAGIYLLWDGGTSPVLPLLGMLFWVPLLWILRSHSAWLAGWVEYDEGGLRVHRLDGESWLPWSQISSVRKTPEGGLLVAPRTGRRVWIPSTLGNSGVLHRMIRRRTEGHSE